MVAEYFLNHHFLLLYTRIIYIELLIRSTMTTVFESRLRIRQNFGVTGGFSTKHIKIDMRRLNISQFISVTPKY